MNRTNTVQMAEIFCSLEFIHYSSSNLRVLVTNMIVLNDIKSGWNWGVNLHIVFYLKMERIIQKTQIQCQLETDWQRQYQNIVYKWE